MDDPITCPDCNYYPCACGGERKNMEAPEWIWLQCDTPNHMAELCDLATPPVAGAATSFAQYVGLPQYRKVVEDRAALTARVKELEGALKDCDLVYCEMVSAIAMPAHINRKIEKIPAIVRAALGKGE